MHTKYYNDLWCGKVFCCNFSVTLKAVLMTEMEKTVTLAKSLFLEFLQMIWRSTSPTIQKDHGKYAGSMWVTLWFFFMAHMASHTLFKSVPCRPKTLGRKMIGSVELLGMNQIGVRDMPAVICENDRAKQGHCEDSRSWVWGFKFCPNWTWKGISLDSS